MSAAVRLLTPEDKAPRDWIVDEGSWGEWEVRVEILSECVYVGLFERDSTSCNEAQVFQMERDKARELAQKIVEACDLVQDIPSRPFD